jgi:hypothetical protein
MASEQGGRSQASPGSFLTVMQQREGLGEKVVNGTSTFATPPVALSDYSTQTARHQVAWNPGDHAVTGTTTERAALFAAPRLLRRNRSGRTGCPLMVRSAAPQFTQPADAWLHCDSSRTKRPDRALPSQSTGATP